MDLKIPLKDIELALTSLVSEIISISISSLTLFVSMSNLFLKRIYIYMSHNSIFVYCKKNLWKFHISNIHLVFHFHFRFSPLHLHSLFRRLDRFIKFVEAENSRPSLHFMVSLFKLCDKAWNASGIQILGCRLTFNVQYCYY